MRKSFAASALSPSAIFAAGSTFDIAETFAVAGAAPFAPCTTTRVVEAVVAASSVAVGWDSLSLCDALASAAEAALLVGASGGAMADAVGATAGAVGVAIEAWGR